MTTSELHDPRATQCEPAVSSATHNVMYVVHMYIHRQTSTINGVTYNNFIHLLKGSTIIYNYAQLYTQK